MCLQNCVYKERKSGGRDCSDKGSIWQNPSAVAHFWSKMLDFSLGWFISRRHLHILLQAYAARVLGSLLSRNVSDPSSTGGKVVFANESSGSVFSPESAKGPWYHYDPYFWILVAWAKWGPKSQNPHLKLGNWTFQKQSKSYYWRKATGGNDPDLVVSSQYLVPLTWALNNFAPGNWSQQHSLPPLV